MKVITGKIAKFQRVVIYGPEGIGKSTLAAAFPKPIFLDTEGGTEALDVARFERPTTWAEAEAAVRSLQTEPHEYSTLVIDTADWLERLAIQHVCQKANKTGIEEFGYGKGYVYLSETIGQFLASLNSLRERMNVLFLAHSMVKRLELPDQAGQFDRYELKLSKQVSPLIKEWSDALLFLNYDVEIVKDENAKARAIGGRERRIHTEHAAAWDAKNRWGTPAVIPCKFENIAAHIPTRGAPAAGAQGAAAAPAPAQNKKVIAALKAQLAKDKIDVIRLKAFLHEKGHLAAPDGAIDSILATKILDNWTRILAALTPATETTEKETA